VASAKCDWYNKHYKNKYLISYSNVDGSTRLYNRDVTDSWLDSDNKDEWWNLFTITGEPTTQGLWLCRANFFKLDRYGHLLMVARAVKPLDTKIWDSFCLDEKGTFRSLGWWYLMNKSNRFIPQYRWRYDGAFNPNYTALMHAYPSLANLGSEEIPDAVFRMYLRNQITIEDLEACLTTPDDWDLFVEDFGRALLYDSVHVRYKDYPLLVAKANASFPDSFTIEQLGEFLRRKYDSYYDLIQKDELTPINGDYATKIEAVLVYRACMKEIEKAERKKKRKLKTVV
jgi:hypothetical protein